MYKVTFYTKGHKPNEEYYYRNLKDAEYHKSSFDDDDSGLYESIEITEEYLK